MKITIDNEVYEVEYSIDEDNDLDIKLKSDKLTFAELNEEQQLEIINKIADEQY
jgi:hypothetical protein